MPKSYDQKMRILYIWDHLQKNSHEQKPVSTNDLLEMLWNKHQIRSERKAVYSDIKSLQEFGVDIITVKGREGGYFIGERIFQRSELKLLIDAVQSSRYLTEAKSRELIQKLCDQCNEQDAMLMRRNIMVSGRVKSMNNSILYNVDHIQDAISDNKMISFRYFDWDIKGQRKYREKEYTASPYGLCQDNENCYLLAHSERHGITSYRVDRMTDIICLDQKRIPCLELTGNKLMEHANRLFQMFAGDCINVKMRFHESLLNVVIDRFGREIMLIPDGDGFFNFTVPVVVSPMFLSWIIGFGNKAKILYPQSVVDQCKDLCRQVMEQY